MTEKTPTIEATTSKTINAQVGDVVTLGVKVAGTAAPTVTPPNGPRLFTARDASGAWVATWAVHAEGAHEITAGVDGADSVTFTVNASSKE